MPLLVPLLPEQIEAANWLHAQVPYWQTTDGVLDALAERFPRFGAEETLIKVIAVNALYGTNLYAVARMAVHAQQLFGDTDLRTASPELIEHLAALPAINNGDRARRHYSFASKFAHFFVYPTRFPIMDTYAEIMLRFHFGRGNMRIDPDHRYDAFVHNFRRLKRLAGFQGTIRELDHYLWLAGLYRKWQKKQDARINVEANRLFFEARGQTARCLDELAPPTDRAQ